MEKNMIKIFIICFVIILSISKGHAFFCINLSNGQSHGAGNSDVTVPLDTDLVNSTDDGIINEYADVDEYMSCINEAPISYTDWFYLKGFQPAINPFASFGVQVEGINYFDTNVVANASPNGVLIRQFPRNGLGTYSLPLKLVMKVNNRPGNGIFIKQGDLLITLNTYKFAWLGSSTDDRDKRDFYWRFYAGNDVVLTEGTCDINDGQLIVVDLGTVHRSRIAPPGGGLNSDGRREVQLTYQCKNNDGSIDTTYDADIKLNLSAIPTSFSPGAVQTRRGWNAGSGSLISYLGIEFYHTDTGQLLIPNDEMNGHFKSAIRNGRGGPDTISIAAVKNPAVSSQDIAEGEFNAVATIVMTLE